LTRGDWQDARLDFLQVVNDTDPQGDLTALAYINLGVVAGQQQDNDQALDYFSKALEVPDVAGEALSNAYFNRGAALAHLEKTEEAIQSYDAAINQSGADGGIRAMALINRAMLLLEKGQEALAWKDLAILLAQTDAPILQQAKAYALQARIAYKSGQWDEVLLAAQAGLKKIASPELHLLVALAHLWRDDGPAARVEIEHLRQTKDAKAVLQQFRQDLDQAVMEGLSATQADKVRDLLPAAAEPSIE
jgi:tetratricopeptide (TPR) repeat protein